MTTTVNPETATKPELIAACRRLNVNPKGGLSRASKQELINWVRINHGAGKPLVVGKHGPNPHGQVELVTTAYRIIVNYDLDSTASWKPVVTVDTSLLLDRSEDFRKLDDAVEALDEEDRYNSTRGVDPEVDATFDRRNEAFAALCLEVTREILPMLAGVVDGDLARAADKAEFAKSTCEAGCSCTPGVIITERLHYRYAPVRIAVEPLKS